MAHVARHVYGVDGVKGSLWQLGWGLAFVLLMTGLAEWGPRTVYSKMKTEAQAITQPVVHAVK